MENGTLIKQLNISITKKVEYIIDTVEETANNIKNTLNNFYNILFTNNNKNEDNDEYIYINYDKIEINDNTESFFNLFNKN